MVKKGILKVLSKTLQAKDTYEITFSPEEILSLKGEVVEGFSFTPGQFINLDFEPKLSRSYSISSTTEESLGLLIKLVPEGKGSAFIERLQVGDSIGFKGPFGHFSLKDIHSSLCFIATGTGIAPFRSMIKSIPEDFARTISLYYGAQTKEDLAYINELVFWHPCLKVYVGLSREEKGVSIEGCQVSVSRITPLLQEGVFETDTDFYLCGNGPMVKDCKQILLDRGFKNIKEERFN